MMKMSESNGKNLLTSLYAPRPLIPIAGKHTTNLSKGDNFTFNYFYFTFIYLLYDYQHLMFLPQRAERDAEDGAGMQRHVRHGGRGQCTLLCRVEATNAAARQLLRLHRSRVQVRQ